MIRWRTLAMLLPLALGACVVGPNYARPEAPLAEAWRHKAGVAAAQGGPWWRAFNDPVLDSLEAEALVGNLSIEQALARVEQARAAARGADAALLPTIDGSGSVAHAEQSLNAGIGQLARLVQTFPRGVDRAQISVGASWDVDFAGGLRRAREGARANLVAAGAGAEAARLAVAADLADAYVVFRGGQMQRARLDELLTLLGEQRQIMAARVRLGTAPRDALAQSDAALAALEAQRPPIDSLIAATEHRIAILLGRSPSRAIAELGAGRIIPAAPDPAAGLPADILRQRADLVIAEQRLIIGNAAIGQAIAQYYPSFSLSALVGLDSNRISRLVGGDSVSALGAVGLRWRLFDFGRIDADVRAARGRARELLGAYREAVLQASAEVETGFVQLAGARARLADLEREAAALSASLATARAAERLGTLSRDARIDRARQVAAAERDIAAAHADVARAVIGCYRALGG